MRLFAKFFLVLAFLSASASAAGRDGNFEIGASLGTPAVGNVHLGLWGPEGFPLLLRASGMYYSKRTNGAQFELGIVTNRGEDFLAYGALLAMTSRIADKAWRGAGAGFGIIYSRLYGGLNITYGRGDYEKNLQMGFQIGFSFL